MRTVRLHAIVDHGDWTEYLEPVHTIRVDTDWDDDIEAGYSNELLYVGGAY